MKLTHIDEATGAAQMVDVTAKPVTSRQARAEAVVHMRRETIALIRASALAKGDAIAVARTAGIMAAKRTSELIPLCHNIGLSRVGVEFEFDEEARSIKIVTTVAATGQTGVEMEALIAASIAALTIYDMAKAVDRAMRIDQVRLLEKSGGASGDYRCVE